MATILQIESCLEKLMSLLEDMKVPCERCIRYSRRNLPQECVSIKLGDGLELLANLNSGIAISIGDGTVVTLSVAFNHRQARQAAGWIAGYYAKSQEP